MQTNHFQGKDGYIWWNGVVEDRKDPLLSPMYLDNTDKMPTSIIVIAGFDPLRDEGFDYAKKLESYGVGEILLNSINN